MNSTSVAAEHDGLRVIAYPGGNKILLAMSLTDNLVDRAKRNLAGFAIWRRSAASGEEPLSNRISFATPATGGQTHGAQWFPSQNAPFQKFRWIDVPPAGFSSRIEYRVRALYFARTNGIRTVAGPEVTIAVDPPAQRHSHFSVAFTRGYIASQAYADRFHDAPIRPKGPKTARFDTHRFSAQYEWLGAEARRALFSFLADCERDTSSKVDVFAYDLDEPDFIAAVCRIGRQHRLRAILDNAALHRRRNKRGVLPAEVGAARMIKAASGAANIRQGHFDRYQHNKVVIQRQKDGTPIRVLFGSMNFSVRGLYVQANNVIVADDPAVAELFGKAFDVAFDSNVEARAFRCDKISKTLHVCTNFDSPEMPKLSLALSPHENSNVGLGPMTQRIRDAQSSVLFAVMEPTGGGTVLSTLREIAARSTIFSYGTVETDKGLAVQSPSGAMGEVTAFAALRKHVPPQFTQEFSGGPGIHIHDKFVVVDFNKENPIVFTGSSNLSSGGEHENGDNLVVIEDQCIATMYAIEAVSLFDHFHFRSAMQTVTHPKPLTLWYPSKPGEPEPWWTPYYDLTRIQLRDRYLFADLPLPGGMQTTKEPDWSKLTKASARPRRAARRQLPPPTAHRARGQPSSRRQSKRRPSRSE